MRTEIALGRHAMVSAAFVVDDVFRLGGRPWLFLAGRQLAPSIRVGDVYDVHLDDGRRVPVEVVSIEFHSPPGVRIIMVDESHAPYVHPGTELHPLDSSGP